MQAQATQPDKPRRWRPLSQAQENAIDLLLAGKTDTDTAADPRVNVARQTVWAWKHEDARFQSELQQRRASLWSATHETLRGLMAKATQNIAASVESGNVADSWNLLRCVGLFGDGSVNAVPGCHLEMELRQRAQHQARQESDLLDQDHSLAASMKRLNWNEAARVEAILAELMDEHTEVSEA